MKDVNPRKDVLGTRHTFTLGECAQDGCGTLKCVALAAHHWQGFRRLGRSMKSTLVWRQLCACDCLYRCSVRTRSCHSLPPAGTSLAGMFWQTDTSAKQGIVQTDQQVGLLFKYGLMICEVTRSHHWLLHRHLFASLSLEVKRTIPSHDINIPCRMALGSVCANMHAC